jgi:hypothetical protein
MSDHATFSFRPKNVQFVLYDIHAVPDDSEDSLWDRDDELGPLSVRTTQLAVGLFDDYAVEIQISTFETEPSKPIGSWTIEATASLFIKSGELGVRDVTSDMPERTISVIRGWSNVRVSGVWLDATEKNQVAQRFHIQIWPET